MISAMKKRISNNKGLTLIELIIVIAIIGILAVIGISQFGGMTEKARQAADEALANEMINAAKLVVAQEKVTADFTFTTSGTGATEPADGASGKAVQKDLVVQELVAADPEYTSDKYLTAKGAPTVVYTHSTKTYVAKGNGSTEDVVTKK